MSDPLKPFTIKGNEFSLSTEVDVIGDLQRTREAWSRAVRVSPWAASVPPQAQSKIALDLSEHIDQLGAIEVYVEVSTKRSPDGSTRLAVLSATDKPAEVAGWLRELADDIAAAGKDAR